MKLDDADIQDLARACAKRFPGQAEQARFAQVAGVESDGTNPDDPWVSWLRILYAAEGKGTLGTLAAALAKAAPGDETLVALARALKVLGAPDVPVARMGVMALAGAAFGLLMVGGVGWVLLGGEPDVEEGLAKVEPMVAAAPAQPASAPVEPAVAEPVAPAQPAAEPAAPEPVAAAPAAEPVVEAPSAPSVPPPSAPPPSPAKVQGEPLAKAAGRLPVGCTGAPAGEVVGYWYAGQGSPGKQGEVIVLDRDARVRADYPRTENGHNAAAAERCVLSRGTRFELKAAPINASKGHYWVPVVGGS